MCKYSYEKSDHTAAKLLTVEKQSKLQTKES